MSNVTNLIDARQNDDEFLDEVDIAAMDAIDMVKENMLASISKVVLCQSKPSVLYRPVLTKQSTAWKAAYGDFVAYGNTPDVAMSNFDAQWSRRGIKAQT